MRDKCVRLTKTMKAFAFNAVGALLPRSFVGLVRFMRCLNYCKRSYTLCFFLNICVEALTRKHLKQYTVTYNPQQTIKFPWSCSVHTLRSNKKIPPKQTSPVTRKQILTLINNYIINKDMYSIVTTINITTIIIYHLL